MTLGAVAVLLGLIVGAGGWPMTAAAIGGVGLLLLLVDLARWLWRRENH
jgi:hypothetical protein